jgi:hypothetical protein
MRELFIGMEAAVVEDGPIVIDWLHNTVTNLTPLEKAVTPPKLWQQALTYAAHKKRRERQIDFAWSYLGHA